MTKTITTEVFTFDELNNDAKSNARQWYLSHNDHDQQMQWDDIKDDAKTIGLRIKSLDDHKANKGDFIVSGIRCAELILENHGKDCETYKTAQQYIEDYKTQNNIEDSEASNDLEYNFLQSLLEDYRIMLNKNYEYIQSDEYVDEAILANEYTFTGDGKRFG